MESPPHHNTTVPATSSPNGPEEVENPVATCKDDYNLKEEPPLEDAKTDTTTITDTDEVCGKPAEPPEPLPARSSDQKVASVPSSLEIRPDSKEVRKVMTVSELSSMDRLSRTLRDEKLGKRSREAIHSFFYPHSHKVVEADSPTLHRTPSPASSNDHVRPRRRARLPQDEPSNSSSHESDSNDETQKDREWVEHVWTVYDDIIILFIFTQLGIVFRLAASKWFAVFDSVFRQDSALFVNLPLNCLSAFLMGVLSSGEALMQIITTRFSPTKLQHDLQQQHKRDDGFIEEGEEEEDEEDKDEEYGLNLPRKNRGLTRRRQQRRRRKHFVSWQPPVHLHDDLREVQLLALERRIRQSPCLLLFPMVKKDVDLMEHYFDNGYQKNRTNQELDDYDCEGDFDDLNLEVSHQISPTKVTKFSTPRLRRTEEAAEFQTSETARTAPATLSPNSSLDRYHVEETPARKLANEEDEDDMASAPTLHPRSFGDDHNLERMEQVLHNVQDKVTENIDRMRRVNLAEGWDVGTTPEAMSDDLMLGLRDGFCGALSSFSSWNSAMVSLLRKGQIGEAMVGYGIGLQLPIVAYRFGQHVAVYVFVWRWRQETRGDEKRGYGIRLSTNDHSERDWDDEPTEEQELEDRERPSVRAICTALFVLAVVSQVTSLFFFAAPQDQQLALSLLFSPLGVFARWRLSKYNSWRPSFPIGTFFANILACALSGSLGTLLAGNPGNEERIFLTSLIAGFAGTLSSLASFIVEILAGVDPLLFRFEGITYALTSLFAAIVVGFVFVASVNWADSTE